MHLRFKPMLVAACLVPLMILAHEFGHFIVGVGVGVPDPQLSMARFTHGPASWLQNWQVAAIVGAGPAVTLGFALLGAALSQRRYVLVPTAVSIAACTRLLELLPYTLSALVRRLLGSPPRATTFDEDVMLRALDLPGDIGLILATLTFAIIVQILFRRHHETAPSLACGGIAGWLSWAAIMNS